MSLDSIEIKTLKSGGISFLKAMQCGGNGVFGFVPITAILSSPLFRHQANGGGGRQKQSLGDTTVWQPSP